MTIKCECMAEFVGINKSKVVQHHREFLHLFGVPLQKYMDPLFGFDVVAFDEQFVKPPDGTSTAEAIEQRWGKRARELIESLI